MEREKKQGALGNLPWRDGVFSVLSLITAWCALLALHPHFSQAKFTIENETRTTLAVALHGTEIKKEQPREKTKRIIKFYAQLPTDELDIQWLVPFWYWCTNNQNPSLFMRPSNRKQKNQKMLRAAYFVGKEGTDVFWFRIYKVYKEVK